MVFKFLNRTNGHLERDHQWDHDLQRDCSSAYIQYAVECFRPNVFLSRQRRPRQH